MAEELKACPFCGGEAEENWGGCAEFYGHEHQSVTIECTKCSAALSIETCCEKDGTPSKGFEFACCCCNPIGSVARSRWNTRSQLPSQGGEAVGVVFTMESLAPGGSVKSHASLNRDLPAGTKLYTHPVDKVADDLTMVKVSRELLQDLRDLASDAVEHHRQAFAGYKQTRQASMDSVIRDADALLAKSEWVKK